MKNTASVSALILAFSAMAGVAVLSAACGDDDSTPGSSTSSGGTSGTSGTSGTPAGDGGTSGSPGTSSGTSGTPGKTGAQAYAEASCAYQKKCTPNGFAAMYADEAACATAKGSAPAAPEGTTAPTDAELTACATALATQDCITPIAACSPKAGTLADGKACNIGYAQCSGGACAGNGTDFSCGTCAAAKAKDAACDPLKFECATGLHCDATAKTCKEMIAKDGACTTADAAYCAPGTGCTAVGTTAGTCKALVAADGDCSAANCAAGLLCNADKKCKEPTYADVGGDCDLTVGKYCKKSACDQADTKKCVAYVATGATCDGGAKACDPSKDTCDFAGDKTCKANAAPKVCQ